MLVGLVANPFSSKDIRRITGLARVIDAEEKANLVARLLVGIGSIAGITVAAVDDQSGIVQRGVNLAGTAGPEVEYLGIDAQGTEADTCEAAAELARLGAAALVTVGGDGTVRAAAEGWPGAPLVPLAAGTNNAFALTNEPTVVGMATALAVVEAHDAFVPTTAIEVQTSQGGAVAVIDAVVVTDHWVGTGAIWDPRHLVEGLVTTSRRTAVGIASISGALGTLDRGHARRIQFGGSHQVRAAFGPGLVLDVPVAGYTDLPIGTNISLEETAGLVALDGERRLPATGGVVRIIDGPKVLDLERAFRRL